MIHFYCKCGQPMSVKPEYIGRTGQCPRCRQPVTVPPQSVTTPPAPARPGAAPPPPGPGPGPGSATTTRPYSAPPHAAPPHAPPPPQTRTAARLEVVHGPADLLGRSFPVGGRAVIGRDPSCEVSIPSDRVSRRHCQLEPTPDGAFALQDLGSSNGTLVNQVRVQGRQVLQTGDYIQTGDCLFRFLA